MMKDAKDRSTVMAMVGATLCVADKDEAELALETVKGAVLRFSAPKNQIRLFARRMLARLEEE